VRTLASNYLPWAALTAVSGVLAFVLDGAYLGATWSRDLRNMMILSFAAYGAALWAFPAMWGNHGLWAALHVFLVVRGVTLLARLPARVRANFGAPYVS
jgi:Na+-driven multidrug efflux pump